MTNYFLMHYSHTDKYIIDLNLYSFSILTILYLCTHICAQRDKYININSNTIIERSRNDDVITKYLVFKTKDMYMIDTMSSYLWDCDLCMFSCGSGPSSSPINIINRSSFIICFLILCFNIVDILYSHNFSYMNKIYSNEILSLFLYKKYKRLFLW